MKKAIAKPWKAEAIALATRKFPCVKYYITQGGFLQEQILLKEAFIMSKNKNNSLAFDVLKREARRTRAWKTAFVVSFAVVIIDRIVGGVKHD